MDKLELRKYIKNLKAKYGEAYRDVIAMSVWSKVEALPEFKNAKSVLLYWSLPDEVSTHEFILKWSGKKHIYLPSISGDELLIKRFESTDRLVKEAQFSILEPDGETVNPELMDIIIVPGVAFDAHGHRLGRGKGFYDRLLIKTTGNKVGVCFPFQMVDDIPHESHDVLMDAVICGEPTL